MQAFRGSFEVVTGDDGDPWDPQVGTDEVSGLEMSRLAVPLPPMLTSVNQIGFDFYDWIGGRRPDRRRLHRRVVRRRQAGPRRAGGGRPVGPVRLPGARTPARGTFSWTAAQVNLWFTFGPVPLRRFDLRGTFGADGKVGPDSQFLAEAVCADIPGYGAQMPITGMCDTAGVITAGARSWGRRRSPPRSAGSPG